MDTYRSATVRTTAMRSSTPEQRREQTRALYRCLRELAQEALILSDQASKGELTHLEHLPYRHFRGKLSEFEAISALLRERLLEAGREWSRQDGGSGDGLGSAEQARADFDRLDLLMLSLFVRTSRRYFSLLAMESALPLGAIEWLRGDLPALAAALEKVRSLVCDGKADPGLEGEMTTALLILNDVTSRIQALPDFSQQQAR